MSALTLNDFFCGCGGMGLGFRNAGFDIVGAWDFDKYAVQSYAANVGDHVRQRDISEMTWDELPTANVWSFGFPCFVAGTMITTSDGLKNVEDIQSGDMVLTHENRFRSVVKPMSQVKQGIYRLCIQGSPETFVTEEHPYYVREVKRVWNNEKRLYERTFSEPKWKDVKDLKPGVDYVGFALNTEACNEKSLSAEQCWLLGRYVADGYVQDGLRSGREDSFNHKVTFCIGKDKLDEFKRSVSEYKLGVTEERTVYKVRIIDEAFMQLCLACGKGAENKRIPGFVMNLPVELLERFLDGYMSGDGCYTNGRYKASSVSKRLVYQLGQAVQKVYGTPYSIHHTKRPETAIIEGRTVNQRDTWSVTFQKELRKQNNTVVIKGVLWCPVKSLEYDPSWTGVVYNMEVEGDNSYVANNCTVHNCQDLSVAGRQAGLFEGKRSSMFFEVMRLLDETAIHRPDSLPTFIVAENVKGLKPYLGVLRDEYEKRGYTMHIQLYNSKYWGVPQNRERYYVVGIRGDIPFEMPAEDTSFVPKLSSILESSVDEKYYVSDAKARSIIEQALKRVELRGTHACITPDRASKSQNGRRAKDEEEPMFTLTVQDLHGVIEPVEPAILRPERTEHGKAVRKQYESGELDGKWSEMRELKPRPDSIANTLTTVLKDNLLLEPTTQEALQSVFVDKDGCAYCCDANYAKGTSPGDVGNSRRTQIIEIPGWIRSEDGFIPKDIANTCDANYSKGFMCHQTRTAVVEIQFDPSRFRVRKLTPTEYGRLQAFPMDTWRQVVSNSQAYKQFGNAVTVTVAEAVAFSIKQAIENSEVQHERANVDDVSTVSSR